MMMGALASFVIIALIIRGVMDYFSRKQMIAQGIKPDSTEIEPLKNRHLNLFSDLKWAFVCLGLGLGLVLKDIFPSLLSETGIVGVMLIGAGLGFLVYFIIAKRAISRQMTDESGQEGKE